MTLSTSTGSVVSLLLLGTLGRVASQKALTDWRSGISTHYGGAQDGMDPYSPSFGTSVGGCGYGVLDKEKYPYWSVAALATSNIYFKRGPLNGCGQCFQIECVNDGPEFQGRCNANPAQRSVTVMITDACPECGSDHIDIQALTFNKIAPMSIGRIAMRYRQVECTPPADLRVEVDQNRGAGSWIRLMVENVAGTGSIQAVQIKGQGGEWEGMNNLWGAAWELAVCPEPPLDFRIVENTGQEVTAFSAIKADGEIGDVPTGVQFRIGTVSSTAEGQDLEVDSSSDSSASAQVSAFSGPDENSGAPASGSDSVIPCITAFQGTTVNPNNCAPGLSGGAVGTSGSDDGGSSPSASTSSSPPSMSSTGAALTSLLRGTPPDASSNPDSSSCSCDDQTPPGGMSCSMQKGFGACSQSWMWQWTPERPKGYCAKTCGFCRC